MKKGDRVTLWADVEDSEDIKFARTEGIIEGKWERPWGFRTDKTPEAGGWIVFVPASPYRDKYIRCTELNEVELV